MQTLAKALIATTLLTVGISSQAQSLKGSPESMQKQYREAVQQDFSFLKTSQAVNTFVSNGQLIKVNENRFLELHAVSFPYARPPVKLFVERLSSQYFATCGEKLVVTSLTRPTSRQPANAAENSVHPTGMAVDLRIPSKSRCRSWLESTLLSLEEANLIEATRERNPPHYHVAVFTGSYQTYVASLSNSTVVPQEYVVRRGDSLSKISSLTGASILQIRAANGLRGDLINVGQKLQIPGVGTLAGISTVDASAANSVAAAPTVETHHQVRRGDTLWKIGGMYGTTASNLKRENELSGDFLQVGQVLRISR